MPLRGCANCSPPDDAMTPPPPDRDPPGRIERELDPSERATLADLAAVLSAALPQVEPAPLNLAVIRARTAPPVARLTGRWRALTAAGWAAAAVLSLSTLYFYQRSARFVREISALRAPSKMRDSADPQAGPRFTGSASSAGNSIIPPGHADQDSAPGASTPDGFFHSGPGGKTYVMVQDLEKLKSELARLEKAHAARFEAQPGLARMVVVELGDPQQAPPSADRKSILTERAADALASGLNLTAATSGSPAASDASLRLSGAGAGWGNDIVIEQGMIPLSRLNLDSGQIVRHLSFPVQEAARYGLEALDQGYFYDAHNQFVWRPSSDGNGYLGWRDESFNADDYRSGATAFPATPPTLSKENTSSSEAPTTPDAAAAPSARAFTLFDETTGGGSIILQNLEPPGDGAIYQLWLTDPATAEPISVGLLPALETGSERVYFEFGKPGVAPGGYLLTREPSGGSRRPGRDVILKGP